MEQESNRVVNDIEGIGAIRSHNGTALTTIAGAASYWQDRAKREESKSRSAWRDGFLTGSVSASIVLAIIASIVSSVR